VAEPQRIAKLLARAGVASRREIERMIEDRRIAIDGVAIETPATIVRSLIGVTVDGQPVAEPDHARLFLYHKPTGLLTAANDPAGRKTIYDRMPAELPRVVPVGRLDLNTEGLLLLTTDGGLKRQLELPATGLERTYRARCYGQITQTQLETLSEGIEIEGVRYGSIDANIERRTGANVWIEMRLREGKNREVRRVLEYFGLEISRLIRTAYGPFVLADLAIGDAVEVLQHDLVSFLKDLKADPGARAARGTTMPRPATAPLSPNSDLQQRSAPVRAAGMPRPVRTPSVPGATRSDRPRSDRAGPAQANRPSERRGERDRPAGRDAARPVRAPKDGARPVRSDRAPTDRPGTSTERHPNPRAAQNRVRDAGASSRTDPRKDRPARTERLAADGATETARPARPTKGKGWAKATKPTKRVGVGRDKRFPRADRPMTDQREDFTAEVPRPPRSADAATTPRRGAPPRDGAVPSRPPSAPGGARRPGGGPASRAPRSDKPR